MSRQLVTTLLDLLALVLIVTGSALFDYRLGLVVAGLGIGLLSWSVAGGSNS